VPRFVILAHSGSKSYKPGRHWDLMLERGGRLRTWELTMPPGEARTIPCRVLPDHRIEYLEYEGPLSRDRGTVERWDAGEYQTLHDDASEVLVELHGQTVRGRLCLRPPSPGSASGTAVFAPE
jgi:hypothetical protein